MHLVTATKFDLILFTLWYKTFLILFLTSLDKASSSSSVSFWILLHYTWNFFSAFCFSADRCLSSPEQKFLIKKSLSLNWSIVTVKYFTAVVKTMFPFTQKQKLSDWDCNGSDGWTKRDPTRKEMAKIFLVAIFS